MLTLRCALRALRTTPAFTLGAVATVALTVGATTAIFSVVYGVLLRQLPYANAERIFWIWSDQPGRDRVPFNVPDFIDYRETNRTLSGLAGYFAYSANLSDEASAERVQGIRATGNLFDVLGARAIAGRLLRPDDERPDADPVVVLNEPFWIRRFGGDRSIVGHRIRLDAGTFTVAGVIAPGFAMPIRDIDVVLPFAPDRDPRRGARNSVNFIQAVGRLAERTAPQQAAADLNAIARRLQERFPAENARKRGVRMVAVLDGVAGPFRTMLVTLFAAVGAVLLIACANLANLMLTRTASRRKDLAVQIALGATRWAVARGVLVEAVLVGAAGGLLGALGATWGVTGLVASAPVALPRTADISVDLTVLTFSLAASLLTGALVGVVPAVTSARLDVRDALQDGSRGSSAGGRHVRGAFVSAEVAIAVALVIAMAMLAKSFANVQAVAPGFDGARVLSARLTLPATRFSSREAILTFQRALIERTASMPGVTATGAISVLPLSGLLRRVPFTVEGRPMERERVPYAQYRFVTPGYFETARIPLTRGRVFSDQDTERTRPVAIVSDALARQWLDGLDPIGARLLVDDNDTSARPIEIVGVAGSVTQIAVDGGPTWDLYLPYTQLHPDNVGTAAGNMFWVARTTGDPMTAATAFERSVRAVDPDVAASQIRPMDRYLTDAIAPRRFTLSLMAAFALSALALAVTGIYSVVLYAAGRRAHELAIRVALGASRARIVRLVAGEGVRFVLAGVAAGLVMAIGTVRLLSTLLFGVEATDAATFVQAAAVVSALSIVACVAPAMRVHFGSSFLSR